jgi:signal peptidase I
MRVVAKQDDLVEIIDNHVEVNGKTMKDSIIVGDSIPSGKQVLGKDQFYVLGDNRRNSNDSRYWGILPHKHIEGKAKSVVYTDTNGLTYKIIGLF